MDGSYDRTNAADVLENAEEFYHAMIRGEITYVPPHDDQDDGIELLETEKALKSCMNASGDGMEIYQFDEGQTNNDDEGQLQTNINREVYTDALSL